MCDNNTCLWVESRNPTHKHVLALKGWQYHNNIFNYKVIMYWEYRRWQTYSCVGHMVEDPSWQTFEAGRPRELVRVSGATGTAGLPAGMPGYLFKCPSV